MFSIIETVNQLSSLAAIGMLIGGAVLIIDWYTRRALAGVVRDYALYAVFLLTAFGSVLTLVYSEVFGYTPCSLCWLQRAFLYPQVFLFGTALYVRDTTVALYGAVLSGVGFLVAVYQHLLQLGVRLQVSDTELINCTLAGGDCAEVTFIEFGFVTFPFIAAGLFFFLFALCFYRYKVAV
ncbi:MAG: disulfide bond formation protein B [Candidatus Paceibacterota bacterium]